MLLLCLLFLSIALHVLLVCFLLLTVLIHSAPIAASLFNKFSVCRAVQQFQQGLGNIWQTAMSCVTCHSHNVSLCHNGRAFKPLFVNVSSQLDFMTLWKLYTIDYAEKGSKMESSAK